MPGKKNPLPLTLNILHNLYGKGSFVHLIIKEKEKVAGHKGIPF